MALPCENVFYKAACLLYGYVLTFISYHMLQSIVCLGDGRAAEGVGLYDICPSQQVILKRTDTAEVRITKKTKCCKKNKNKIKLDQLHISYLVYFVNDVRLRETQEVVVALEWVRVLLELLALEVFLLQVLLLDHGPHAAI